MANLDNDNDFRLEFDPQPGVLRQDFTKTFLKTGALGLIAGAVATLLAMPLAPLTAALCIAGAGLVSGLAGGTIKAIHTHGEIDGAMQTIELANDALESRHQPEFELEPELPRRQNHVQQLMASRAEQITAEPQR